MIALFFAGAALALIVLGFVFFPLARGRAGRDSSREKMARGVYRDQLAELVRDRDRGAIDQAQAETARREIERRLLASDRPETEAPPVTPSPVLAASLALGALAVAVALYWALGAPGMPDQPYAGRAAERDVAAHRMPIDLDQAVADLERKLAANPDNLDGWLLLARTEAARQHWQKSAEAMGHAMALAKDRPDIAAAYGTILVRANGGLVTPPARDAFAKALSAEPANPEALWYLGLAAVQDKKPDDARAYWQKLAASLPADSEDRKNVAAALDALDAATGAKSPHP